MKAQDIMSKNPTCVTPDTTLADAARLMKTENIGVVPVVESESSKRLVGVLTDRDIAVRAVAEGRDGATRRPSATSCPPTSARAPPPIR